MKLITLREITLHNFMGYKGDTTLDFHGKDIVGILAEYEADATRSNRGGKCFGAGTPIMMFDGSVKPVETISNGEMVMGPDSKPRTVAGVTSGTEEMFKVESGDGSISFTCNRSHILALKPSCKLTIDGVAYSKEDIVTITVNDFLDLPDWKKNVLNLFRSDEIELSKKNILLDPYVLGVWLGDGANSANKITISDKEIFDYLHMFAKKEETNFLVKEHTSKKGEPYWDISLTGKVQGFQSSSSTSVVSRTLKDLNLFDNKHVPEMYLKSSISDRLELLAGLIDTDGHLSKGRFYEIICKYEKLKDGIVHLCRSLGLAVSVNIKEGKIDGVSKGNYYRINIYGNIGKIPCKVVHKKTSFTTTKRDVLRKGFTVSSLGEGQYYGFTVDSDHLFLLGDFTVVHNTTILEAIGYNLTGLSRTKDEQKLIHHGQKEMWVIGVYTDGDRDYTIKRGRDHKGKGILEVDWIQKVSECQEEIEKIFGITPKDFHLTSFFKQADTEGFMKMKPSEKASFLMQWLDNEHWREKEARANEDRKVVKEKLRDNENLKKALEASLEIDESLESIKAELERDNKQLSKQKDHLSEQLGAVNADIRNLNEKRDEVSAKMKQLQNEKVRTEQALDEYDDDTDAYNQCKKKFSDLKKQIEALDLSISPKDINEQIDILKAKKSEITNIIKTSKEHSSAVCPILKQSCDRLKFDPKELERLQTELVQVEADLKSYTQKAQNHLDSKNLNHQMEIQKERAQRIKERLTKKPELEKRLAEIVEKLPELSDAIASLNLTDLQTRREAIKHELDNTTRRIKSNSDQILAHEIRISEAKKAKEKIDKVVESNIELQKKLTLLNYTCFMFSKNGIPALEIENSFQEIEDNINWILDEILTGVSVSFSPDKALKSLEAVCSCGFQFPKGFRGATCPDCDTPRQKQRKEEITFKVLENGIEQDFEMDSGGGKQIISYAVRIALTMLKRGQRKCNLNMLFLDEVDSALDPYLASQVIGSITNFLTKKLGYQQVVLVSHKEQIKSSVPYIIKATKHDTYSTARFM